VELVTFAMSSLSVLPLAGAVRARSKSRKALNQGRAIANAWATDLGHAAVQ